MEEVLKKIRAATEIRKALGRYTQAILVKCPQGVFLVPADDMYLGWDLRHKGEYAVGELRFLGTVCNSSTRLLVVGAHIGALMIPLARTCRSVVAVEANPQTVELLRLNLMLNGLPNCRVLHKAASDKAGWIEFVLNQINSGASKRLPLVRDPLFFFDSPEITKVEAAPLDELLPGETFDVIIMDIEGSETFALRGMQRILSTAAVLQVEFLPLLLQTVAGVSVRDFVSLIEPHFQSMHVPRRAVTVGRQEFLPLLSEMYQRGQNEYSLIFLKAAADAVSFPNSAPVRN